MSKDSVVTNKQKEDVAEEEVKYYVFVKKGRRHFAPQYLAAGETTVKWVFPVPEPNTVGTLDKRNNGIAFIKFGGCGVEPEPAVIAKDYVERVHSQHYYKFCYQEMSTVELGEHLVNLNTKMYNLDNRVVSIQDGKIVDDLDRKDIPSLIFATTMDMEFAHIDGYKGEAIPYNASSDFQNWEAQIEDMERAAELNPLRLFPLHSYDPRRYSLSGSNDKKKGRWVWKEPFKRIVGHGDSADGIKKIWTGFCMNPALGFRPFDEFCEHLPRFYKECEKNKVPILAHCAPGGIIAHEAEYYTNEPGERRSKSESRHKMILEEKLSDYQGGALCSCEYYGDESVIGDEKKGFDKFYKSHGHPRNWVPVLEYFPKLHLCLSGFGGNIEWQLADWPDNNALPTRQWIRCIILLTAKYENVYADISGLNIYDEKIKDGLLKMLKLVHNDENKEFSHLKYKLIFGSGWYFTHRTESYSHNYGDYCREFKRFFDCIDPTGKFWERVSLINPWNFYALSKEKFENMHKALPGADDKESLSSKTLSVLVELSDYISNGESSREWPEIQIKLPINKKCQIFRKLGETHYNELHRLLETYASNIEKKLWVQFEPVLKVGKTAAKTKSEYNVKKNYVDIDIELTAQEKDGHKAYQTAFHEFWHNIDSLANKKIGSRNIMNPFSFTYKDNLFGRIIIKEVEERVAQERRFNEILEVKFGKGQDVYKNIEDDIFSRSEPGYLSDIVSGATGAKVKSKLKRDSGYWKIEGKLSAEAFANIAAASAANHEALETIKSYLPKTYEVYQEIQRTILAEIK